MDNEAIRIGRQQIEKIDTGLLRASADYKECLNAGDEESAGMAMQQYADLMAQRNNLMNAYYQQVAAEQAAVPRPPTQEEIIAKPITAMNHQELFDHINRTSKHGADLDAYKRGMDYVARNPIRR